MAAVDAAVGAAVERFSSNDGHLADAPLPSIISLSYNGNHATRAWGVGGLVGGDCFSHIYTKTTYIATSYIYTYGWYDIPAAVARHGIYHRNNQNETKKRTSSFSSFVPHHHIYARMCAYTRKFRSTYYTYPMILTTSNLSSKFFS